MRKVNSVLILEVLKVALIFAEPAKLCGLFRWVSELVVRIVFVDLAKKDTLIKCW